MGVPLVGAGVNYQAVAIEDPENPGLGADDAAALPLPPPVPPQGLAQSRVGVLQDSIQRNLGEIDLIDVGAISLVGGVVSKLFAMALDASSTIRHLSANVAPVGSGVFHWGAYGGLAVCAGCVLIACVRSRCFTQQQPR